MGGRRGGSVLSAALLAVLIHGCGTTRAPERERADAAPASPRVPALRRTLCGESIPGVEGLLEPGGILVLGEVHGTQEAPRFVGDMACQVAADGLPLVLALELPVPEQPALSRYLLSEGGPEDRARLVEGAFWGRPYQDGRTSRALVALIERVRVLNRQGLPIELLAYLVDGLQGSERGGAMAKVLLDRRAQERTSRMLVLSGNVNARAHKGVPWDAGFVPMGWHLARAGVPFRTLDMKFSSGLTWDCRLGPDTRLACGAHPARSELPRRKALTLRAMEDGRPVYTESEGMRGLSVYGRKRRFIELDAQAVPEGFDGFFYVAGVQASPPAHAAGPPGRD